MFIRLNEKDGLKYKYNKGLESFNINNIYASNFTASGVHFDNTCLYGDD